VYFSSLVLSVVQEFFDMMAVSIPGVPYVSTKEVTDGANTQIRTTLETSEIENYTRRSGEGVNYTRNE
jgi:hypothetical protein